MSDNTQETLTFDTGWDLEDALKDSADFSPYTSTGFGHLLEGDCLDILPELQTESIDLVFADPPFNLDKEYGEEIDDDREEKEYLSWCKNWLDDLVRVLKPGGSLFVYNLPKWAMPLGTYLMNKNPLNFRHWIAVSIKASFPIQNQLYPAHYALLYFSKGKPKTFRNIRTPIETCRHCGGEIKDYGGHRDKMNPKGVNLTDVWTKISPVRHWKFKNPKRDTNQLSTKLVRRALEMGTEEGDFVLDPFGGAGTTFDVCERIQRYWLGIEIESCDVIDERLARDDIEPHEFTDYVEK